jgi:hypothetical protein
VGSNVVGGPLGGGTGIDYDAVRKALAEREGKVDSLFGSPLGIETGQFGLLGKTLSSLLGNPWGFRPEDLQAARTRISEREAGLRTSQLSRLNASKFGPRVADYALRESLRGQSASRITDQELALDMSNQQMKQQNFLAAISAALNAAGVSAGLTGQHAQLTAQMFDPIAAGTDTGGSGALPAERGLKENRLPGETLADQLRREAAAWQAHYGGATTPTG